MAGMVVTYRYPVAGGVPPTAGLMRKKIQVIAQAVFTNGDNDPTPIVHNMNVSADGSDGQPKITVALIAQGATAKVPTVAFTDANTVTITSAKVGLATDNFTAVVTLERRK